MTLYSGAISAGDLTAIRSGNVYRAIQYALAVPNDVVVQFQPSVNPDTVFAEIGVGTIASGDMANVLQGQTVIFSTTSDYQATETYRTYVRKYINVGTLYVGENSQALTTSEYVTVIDTYEVHQKPRRDDTRLDWDVTWRELLPIETAIPSAVVVSNGGTSYQPPTSCTVMDADASSISTYAWTSSNSNDSFSSTTTAQPTITLEAGAFRWLRVTFTDDLGNSNFRVFPCWTVDRDYGSVVTTGWGNDDGTLARVSYDTELGWTCDVQAFSGITSLLDRTMLVIASDNWYNDTRDTIRTNIDFVGYLRTENTDTRGDEQHGQLSDTTFIAEGFGHQFARQNITSALIQRVASPSAWDEIKNPTPARMVTYRLTEYSTASTLCALSIPSDDTSFVGDDLILDNDVLLDDIRYIAEVINAELQFDIDGKLDMCRNLNFLDDTARDAATTIATLTPADFASRYRIDFEYGYTTSAVDMKGGAFDSTNSVYDVYEATAPAGLRYSEGDPLEITNQVLTTDAAASDALDEIAERAANWLAYNNPTYIMSVTLKDEWYFLVPDIGSWFKFTIAATDTVRGRAFGASDRWQLIQISVSTNSLTGRRQVDATFRLETQSTDSSVRAAPSIYNEDADYNYVPAVLPPFNYDSDLTDGNWFDELSPEPPSNPNPVPSTCYLNGLRPKSGDIVFTEAITTGTVNVRVRGHGVIGAGSWCYTWDFSTIDGGFVGYQNSSQPIGDTYNNQWVSANHPPDAEPARILSVRLAIPSANYTITDMSINVSRSGGVTSESTFFGIADSTWPLTGFVGFTTGVTGANSLTGLSATNKSYIMFYTSHNSNSIAVDSFTLKGTGENPFTNSNCTASGVRLGDAFYYSSDGGSTWQAYGVGDGLYIEGSQPNIPPYNPQHEYYLPSVTVTGLATISYEFKAGTLNTADFENWNLQMITCENS